MLTRVSDSLKFNTAINNLFKVQTQYNDLAEKMATQKKVNRPSDDPIGTSKILGYRSAKKSIATYQKNIESSSSWLTISESKLSGVYDAMTQVKETAIAQANATASAETRSIAATSLSHIIDEIRALANSKIGDRYLFSGSKANIEPFPETSAAASIGTPAAATNNTFNGTVTAGGAYTGTVNKTYAVRIVSGGALAAASYQISSDGGKTWGATASDLSSPISLGDGVQLTFAAGTSDMVSNDIFYVQAKAAGYYQGNGENLSVEIEKGTNFNYNITGEEAFTDNGNGTVDVFAVLDNLKTALENNDVTGIQSQLTGIDDAMNQVNRYISKCGTAANRLDICKSNVTKLDENITDLVSSLEDADMAELITQFSSKEVALQASYELTGRIGQLSIMDYLN